MNILGRFLGDNNVSNLLYRVMLFIFLALSPNLWAVEKNETTVLAQDDIIIEGTVLDDMGLPLIGATVAQQGTSKATSTDFDGKFTLKVPLNSTIEISFIGFKTKVVAKVNKSMLPFKIKMETDSTGLNEVVVVGFAKQKKQTLVGAVTTIKGETLKQVGSVSTISEALQGAAPGLTAVNSNGKPGSDAAQLFLRGRSSWQGNGGPLTLVDGIERDLNNLDPNEIETISVLKDASATAVYGVRGANGVILITTKRGKIGKPKFNFTANLGFKESTANPKYSDYITAQKMYNEAATNDRNWGQLIPESTISAWEQNYDNRGPYNIYFPEVNWTDELMGTGIEQTYNLNVAGGSTLVKYFVSLGYRDDGDIFKTIPNEQYDPAFGLQRYNWRSNFDFDVTSTTKFSVSFSGNYRERFQPGYRIDGGGEDGFGQAQFFNLIFRAPRNLFPIRDEDGIYGESSTGDANIIMRLNEGGKRTYQYFQGFYDAELKQGLDFITKGLSAKASINYTSFSNYEKQILRGGVGGGDANFNIIRYFRQYDYANPIVGANGKISYPILTEIRYPSPQAQEGPVSSNTPSLYDYNRRLNYRFQMDYKRTFGDHQVSTNTIMWRQSDVGRSGYPNKREEWIGRLNYYYKERYLLEVNGSYSGSEKFAPGLRYGFFPSMGLGWVISEEPLIKKFAGKWLDLLKVNYSYGITGDDGGPRFQYFQSFGTATNINLGYDNLSPFGPTYTEGALANTNSTWEESRTHNLSFKAELFKGLSFNLDLYKSQRTGILMDIRLPSYIGVDQVATGNIGETKNHGYELELGWKDNITDILKYNINLSTAFTENRTVFRNDPRFLSEYLKQEGKPIGWASRMLAGGLYQSLDDIYNGPGTFVGSSQSALIPGDVQFVDYNGDGVVDSKDSVPMDQVQNFPLRTYTLNLGVDYKGFALSARFYGVTDVGYLIPDIYYFDFNNYIQANENVIGRWTPENALTAVKPALHLSNNHNKTPSTLTYVDGSYLRLKSLEFSYKFENGLIDKFGLNSLQLYVNGNNLFTWSKLDGQIDPETSGADTYPVVKRYSLGLRVTF
ncbi:TonB-linked outer membrane protein, SusC/RagA family [Flavobacterium flevense]|uniref:SusC/RagA family TonB-linked outer membrane protein n=1 Tax=Flavobacterium flevense TaxID=983 RepID=A0A4Y4AX37_9FLAO|nr:TonB-dependent receptor [Flavobacterium flevense]GEC72778.1 SusC/RagA family TonB-linked outer membrane protein [Flavobacterium flevense]SHM16734.1 TonB-linked outer membrane protein, SusC/RagA family [Flavobacterium flevense]